MQRGMQISKFENGSQLRRQRRFPNIYRGGRGEVPAASCNWDRPRYRVDAVQVFVGRSIT